MIAFSPLCDNRKVSWPVYGQTQSYINYGFQGNHSGVGRQSSADKRKISAKVIFFNVIEISQGNGQMKRRLTCHAEAGEISKKTGKWCSLAAPALLLALASDTAHAHIKWFVEFDIADPPRPLTEVLDPYFLALLAMASVGLFLTYTVDAFWTRTVRFAILDRTFGWRPDLSTSVVRLGMGILFVSLWLMGALS